MHIYPKGHLRPKFYSSYITKFPKIVLLDSQLYMRIDAAELLIWVQEQSEEKSINLTKFTEHFNNMSYWTRTLILKQPDAKVCKIFILPSFF